MAELAQELGLGIRELFVSERARGVQVSELHELLGYVGGVVRWRGGRLVFFGGLFLLPLLAVLTLLRAVVGLTVAGVVVFAAPLAGACMVE